MKKINLSSLNIFLKNGKIPLCPKSNKDLIHKNPINYFLNLIEENLQRIKIMILIY
jgi:hypothetical protein